MNLDYTTSPKTSRWRVNPALAQPNHLAYQQHPLHTSNALALNVLQSAVTPVHIPVRARVGR